jgi:UDP-N-acetylglucosamine--N-acetylmuramyl-(pentapeptide) pyrophosphoryl-undecaprenol N-acetylglucosamine transferase
MQSALRIMLTGGGTGGHFYPLIALGEALRKSGQPVDLYYIGPDAYDAAALRSIGAELVTCPAGKQRRYASFLNVLDIFKVIGGFFVALKKLYVLYPDVIVSKGGYTSVPVILAAAFLRIPIIVHESDTKPGRANALAARFTKHVAISFEAVREFFTKHDVVMSGIPVRSALLAPPQGNEHDMLGIDPSKKTILVLGGSQGAERINTLMLDSLDNLLPEYTIIHQTGKSNFDVTVLSARELVNDDALLARYRPIAFFEDPAVLGAAYNAADLIISRAGTGSIYEIALHGKPAILIPIPETVSHDQRTNAYAYARSGAATVLEEANLGDVLLTEEISRIMKNTAVWSDMAARARAFAPGNGADILARLTLDVASTHS